MRATRVLALVTVIGICGVSLMPANAQVKGHVPGNIKPAWTKGIQPISRESYWNAIECGKQGGDNPPCVFYDTGLCSNEAFTLSLYTPYKMVAYTVWQAVRKKQPPPTPNYAEAQRTRVVLGVRSLQRAKNPLKALALKRGGRVVPPSSHVLDGGGGTFTYDFAAFAPTASMTIELTGPAQTITCSIDRATLARMR